jgi:hypothetical protein
MIASASASGVYGGDRCRRGVVAVADAASVGSCSSLSKMDKGINFQPIIDPLFIFYAPPTAADAISVAPSCRLCHSLAAPSTHPLGRPPPHPSSSTPAYSSRRRAARPPATAAYRPSPRPRRRPLPIEDPTPPDAPALPRLRRRPNHHHHRTAAAADLSSKVAGHWKPGNPETLTLPTSTTTSPAAATPTYHPSLTAAPSPLALTSVDAMASRGGAPAHRVEKEGGDWIRWMRFPVRISNIGS